MKSQSLFVYLNSSCNLSCHYCYMNGEVSERPDEIFETVMKLLDEYRIEKIVFTGGEPLLSFELLQELCKEVPEKVEKHVVTNGILLDKDKIKWLREEDVRVKLSIDTSAEVKREKSLSPLETVVGEHGDFLRSVSKVITPENLERLEEDLEALKKQGFEQIDANPQMYCEWDDGQLRRVLGELHRFKKRNPGIRVPILEKGCEDCYSKCRRISVTPDGKLTVCNSMVNSEERAVFDRNSLNDFEVFRERFGSKAFCSLEEEEGWFEGVEEYLCLVDSFYSREVADRDSCVENGLKIARGLRKFI